MRCGMQLCRFIGRFRKTALELLLRAGLGFLLMLLKCCLKALGIDGQAVLLCHFLREFDRETEGIKEPECVFAVDNAVFKFALDAFKLAHAVDKGALEACLLRVKLHNDMLCILFELGVYIAVIRDNDLCYPAEGIFAHAELHCVPERTADEPSQDIALIDIGGGYAPGVAEQEGCGTDMIRNNAECLDRIGIILIILAGKLGYLCKDINKCIGIIDALSSLKGRNRPFKAHAGIYVLLFKGTQRLVDGLEVFHEYVIPDFKILAAGAGRIAALAALFLARIEEYLGIGAAGTARTGDPPVMLCAEIEDMGGIHAHFDPAIMGIGITGRILIALEAGEIQPVLVDSEPLLIGEQLPAPGNGFLLKIIAERPVPEHLEEGQMACVADRINITGTDAFLDVGKPLAGRMSRTHEIGYQGMHACGGKKDSGIIFGDQGSGRNNGMSFRTEKLKKELAKFCRGERFHLILTNL